MKLALKEHQHAVAITQINQHHHSEVKQAISELKSNKSPGIDEVAA